MAKKIQRTQIMMFWLLLLTIIFNVIQLLTSNFKQLLTKDTILAGVSNNQLMSDHYFSCNAQKALVVSEGKSNDSINGIFPVFIAEIVIVFIIFWLIIYTYNKLKYIPKRKNELKVSLLFMMLFFLIDQTRYIYSSIIDDNKSLYTWSSYCLQGDISWYFDALGYASMYFALGLAMAGFVTVLNRTNINNIELKFHMLGLEKEHAFLTGVFYWLTPFALAFFFIWVAATKIDISSSKLYAVQAILIFSILLTFYLLSSFKIYKINVYYKNQLTLIRKEIAKSKGMKFEEVSPSSISSEIIAENPFEDFFGANWRNFWGKLICLGLPLISYVSIFLPSLDSYLQIYKFLK